MNKEELQFLFESNKIEGVYDADSLMQAVYAWLYLKSQYKITGGVVLKTHKIISLHSHLLPDQKGYFRKSEVKVGARICKPWYVVPELITSWCEFVNKKKNEEEILQDHIKYEEIHPFVDFNGRTGRMFMNWQRLNNDLPILIIKEEDKYDYYKLFDKIK